MVDVPAMSPLHDCRPSLGMRSRQLLSAAGHLTPRFIAGLSINRRPAILSQSLYSQTRLNPPQMEENRISSLTWLRSRLAKVDAGVMRDCFAVYIALLGLSDVDFLEGYIVLLPECFPGPALPQNQLGEALLREEFGGAISEPLVLLPGYPQTLRSDGEFQHPDDDRCDPQIRAHLNGFSFDPDVDGLQVGKEHTTRGKSDLPRNISGSRGGVLNASRGRESGLQNSRDWHPGACTR